MFSLRNTKTIVLVTHSECAADISRNIKVRKMAKNQETIQSSATPGPGYYMGKLQKTMNITNKSQEVNPFPAFDHKAAMNRRENMRNTRRKKHKWSTKEVPPKSGQ